ncbi:MAG: hypothetical protein HFJ94_03820 [Muribaculaceae bacterium]|nr:hypothetical protein [Muribaculaceae bacterium]
MDKNKIIEEVKKLFPDDSEKQQWAEKLIRKRRGRPYSWFDADGNFNASKETVVADLKKQESNTNKEKKSDPVKDYASVRTTLEEAISLSVDPVTLAKAIKDTMKQAKKAKELKEIEAEMKKLQRRKEKLESEE